MYGSQDQAQQQQQQVQTSPMSPLHLSIEAVVVFVGSDGERFVHGISLIGGQGAYVDHRGGKKGTCEEGVCVCVCVCVSVGMCFLLASSVGMLPSCRWLFVSCLYCFSCCCAAGGSSVQLGGASARGHHHRSKVAVVWRGERGGAGVGGGRCTFYVTPRFYPTRCP